MDEGNENIGSKSRFRKKEGHDKLGGGDPCDRCLDQYSLCANQGGIALHRVTGLAPQADGQVKPRVGVTFESHEQRGWGGQGGGAISGRRASLGMDWRREVFGCVIGTGCAGWDVCCLGRHPQRG